MNDMNKLECQNQLDWSAFCYLAGEMGPGEEAQFEARLAAEQPAREALARAVELTQVVAAAETHCGELVRPAADQRIGWSTRLAWMAVGGLASALIAVLWSGANFGVWPESSSISKRHNELAALWAETGEELRTSSEIDPLLPRTIAASGAEEDLDADVLDETFLVAEAPSWMTVAVEGLAGEMDQDESGSDEPVVN